MAVRMKRPGKRVLALLGILAVFAAGCIGFTGCRGGSGDTEKIRDLEFTVTGEGRSPRPWQSSSEKRGRSPLSLHMRTGRICISSSGRAPRPEADTALPLRSCI